MKGTAQIDYQGQMVILSQVVKTAGLVDLVNLVDLVDLVSGCC